LTGELLNLVEGIQLVGIPYKSSAQMTTDGLGGQIEILIHNTPVLLPHIRAQKLRPLAITSDKRSPAEPQIPTMIESGVKDFEITAWFGFMAPTGTPRPLIDKLPDVNKRIVDQATEVVGSTPEQYAAFIKSETAKWKDVIIRAKMTAD
jgi:tripartite-type tricarboxylate transporter receptor subunit TctC